jgi:hypothetical protein
MSNGIPLIPRLIRGRVKAHLETVCQRLRRASDDGASEGSAQEDVSRVGQIVNLSDKALQLGFEVLSLPNSDATSNLNNFV